jgi:uncharacterized repeat protein (TIGR03803 family)
VDWDGTLYGFGCRGNTGTDTLFGVTPDNQSFWYGDIPGTDGEFCGPNGAGGDKVLTKGWDGRFYGTTYGGGAAHLGSIFSVEPDLQTTYMILHEFTEGPDGCYPTTGLIQADDGNFYGTTFYGCGSGGSHGTVFQLTPDGTFTTIHSFSQAEGEQPAAPLIQASDGLLYGTTYVDGPSGAGTVFRMTLDGECEQTVAWAENKRTVIEHGPCPRCGGAGWLCKAHPGEIADHDPPRCAGPAMPCPTCRS